MTTKENRIRTFKDLIRKSSEYAMGSLNIQLLEIDEDHIVLQMPITNTTRQPLGLWHGGMSIVIAETAASIHACFGIDLTQKVPVGIEVNGSHLRSASEGNVRAVGTIVRRSRSIIVHQVEIYHWETKKVLCVARITNYYKKIKS